MTVGAKRAVLAQLLQDVMAWLFSLQGGFCVLFCFAIGFSWALRQVIRHEAIIANRKDGSIILADESRQRGPWSAKRFAAVMAIFLLGCYWLLFNPTLTWGSKQVSIQLEPPSRLGDHLPYMSIHELQSHMESGNLTSRALTEIYGYRWVELDRLSRKGSVNSLISLRLEASLNEADALDQERRQHDPIRSQLHGIPMVVKDNIDVADISTTAGSFALEGSLPAGDSEVVRRLREAGAIIWAKANLDEWAGSRSSTLPSGWSAMGGQCTSIYYHNGNPRGSSSGSAVAVSLGLAAAALGTDTCGSVIAPASANNVVGLRPTTGLVSRIGVIPGSLSSDTIGPLTVTVSDAALLLSILAGPDHRDVWTRAQPRHLPDYMAGLRKDALRGARIGVLRQFFPKHRQWNSYGAKELWPDLGRAYDHDLKVFRRLGATVVDPADFEDIDAFLSADAENCSYYNEIAVQVAEYLSTLKVNPNNISTVQDIIDFNNAHADLEKPLTYESQDVLEAARQVDGYTTTVIGLREARQLASHFAIYSLFSKFRLDALIWPAPLPVTTVFASAGFPILSVPLGSMGPDTRAEPVDNHTHQTYLPYPGMPFGLAIGGLPWSEDRLLAYGYAYEQASRHRWEFEELSDTNRRPRHHGPADVLKSAALSHDCHHD